MTNAFVFVQKKLWLAPLIVMLVFFVSCIEDNFDFDRLSGDTGYRPSFIVPLAHGSLTLGNLLEAEDSQVIFDPDNSIRILIREDSLFSVSLDDFFEIPIPDPVSQQFSTDPVSLDDITTFSSLNLNEIASRISEPQGSYISGSNGMTVSFPAIPPQYLGNLTAEVIDDIEYVQFAGGEVGLKLNNNLPVVVSFGLRLVNATDWTEVGVFQFDNLAVQETRTVYADLADVTIHSNLMVELLNFSTPGSGGNPVFINLNDEIEIDVTSRDLLAIKGKAKVARTVLDIGNNIIDLDFEDDQQIDELNIKLARIDYNILNSSGGLSMSVELPNLISGGNPAGFDILPDGAGGIMSGSAEIIDADFDFSTYPDQIVVDYILYIGSDEGMVEFDLTGGALGLDLEFSNFEIGYASGYFGQSDFELDDEDFDFDAELFDKLTGDFWLTNPSIRMFYDNTVGVPVNLLFNLSAQSSDGSKQADLFDNGHPGFTLAIPDVPYNEASGEILISRETSNIVDFIALPPSNINFKSSSVKINPDGQTSVPNFITSEGKMQMGMEFELPLELKLTNLGFADTLELDMDMEDIDFIDLLVLVMEVKNSFPLGIALDLSLYDSRIDQKLHTFNDVVLMEAAPVNADGTVVPGSEARSSANIEISSDVIEYFNQADNLIVSARMNTGKHNESQVPVKLQTTNRLDFTIRLAMDINIKN